MTRVAKLLTKIILKPFLVFHYLWLNDPLPGLQNQNISSQWNWNIAISFICNCVYSLYQKYVLARSIFYGVPKFQISLENEAWNLKAAGNIFDFVYIFLN